MSTANSVQRTKWTKWTYTNRSVYIFIKTSDSLASSSQLYIHNFNAECKRYLQCLCARCVYTKRRKTNKKWKNRELCAGISFVYVFNNVQHIYIVSYSLCQITVDHIWPDEYETKTKKNKTIEMLIELDFPFCSS